MFPFVSALTQAGGIILDKIILTRQRVEIRVFVPILFIFLFILSAILMPFLGWVHWELFTLKNIGLFIAMIGLAFFWNILYYRGAQAEKVHEFELIIMAQPLVTVLLAGALFVDERNWYVLIAAIIAACALFFAKFTREHISFSKEMWGLVWAVLLMSVELILIKLLLHILSPTALYAARTGLLAIAFYLYYRPHLKAVSRVHYAFIATSAALGTIQMITKFYGFETLGVVYTSLIIAIAPVLVYIASSMLLHERIKLRTIISGLVILGCIIFATIMS